jgi:putative DNA primase/helicase
MRGNGGVERCHLAEALSVDDCTEAIRLEWNLIPKLKQEPGTPDDEIKRLAKSELLDTIAHTRRVIRIWQTVRELLDNPEIEVSGRLTLKLSNGQRVIEWRGVAPIGAQFRQAPTLMLDATLPDLPVLEVYYPQAEIVADIKVAMPPHVHIRQVLGAPTSSSKLIETGKLKDTEQHLNAVRRYIWQRYFETGRQRSLVVCQERVEEWLEGKLPKGVAHEHFNNIAGLDEFKDVRLEILIGRTAPGPAAPEALAAALSGRQPQTIAPNPKGYDWYPQIKRGIRLVNGEGVAVDRCDQHPDPFVESIRWLVCEAELVQALGRGRGINRTAETPLDIDILSNVVLPIAVNEVVYWKAPSLLIETAMDGVMLTSPADMVKLWPHIWPNTKAADRTLKQGVPDLPGFERVEYQLKGAKMNRRWALFDRSLIPDPLAWLGAQLGALAAGTLGQIP